MLETLAREASVYGIKLTTEQFAQFARYLDVLTEWSSRLNLVSNADPQIIQRRHFAESIAFGAALREREILRPGLRVLDLGSGAGFPGLPIKIVWPGVEISLLEATAKKAAFLRAAAGAIGLAEETVVSGRAETLAHDPSLRESFDLVLARAVAPLPVLLELALPFAQVRGRVATLKGSRAHDEIAASESAAKALAARLFSSPMNIPGPPQRLIVALKERPTPPAYPRRPGIPTKTPL